MRLLNQLRVVTAAALIVAACSEGPIRPDVADPSFDIVDAVHNSGNEHFFWLPPIVGSPVSFNGAFDGTQSPVVRICDLADCAANLIAEYTSTTGPGSETVRVVPIDEHYIVNWHTDEFAITPGPTYRIRVLVAGTELGLTDVQLGATGKEVKNITTNEIIGLKDGRTLAIKFRIEDGAVFVVGSSGGTITAIGSDVTLVLASGALTEDAGITVEPDVTHPPAEGTIDGAGFEFGPDGLVFAAPVTLTIAYDEVNIPAGFPETGLTLATQLHDEGDLWEEILSTVDVAANTVTGTIAGFSNHNVKKKVTSLDVDPTSAILEIGATVQLAATPRDALGVPLADQNVTWSSSSATIATVGNKTGLVTAVTAGTVTIEAKTTGTTGTAAITVVSPGALTQIGAILNDPFATQLVTNLSVSPRQEMQVTLDQCATGISQGNLTTVGECLATARSQVGAATDPTDRVLLAVFDRSLDFAERLLTP